MKVGAYTVEHCYSEVASGVRIPTLHPIFVIKVDTKFTTYKTGNKVLKKAQ